MLVQALAEYADNNLSEQLNDAAWEKKPVPWMLEISRQGTFLSAYPRMTTVTRTRGKKQVQIQVPQEVRVPRSPVNRNSGEHPLLGTDDIAYVLGAGVWTSDKPGDRKKAERHHEAFVALVNRAAGETGDPALAACAKFYAAPEEVDKARDALREAKPDALVALSVGGALAENETVQRFWREHYRVAFVKERIKGNTGECIITGKFGDIVLTHDKIKGLSNLGGRAEVGLMSFDKPAFRSYGWEQNQNSPVSPGRAIAYVLALNDLLKPDDSPSKSDKGKRRDIAGIGFLYWLRNAGDIDAFGLWDGADPDQVTKLLDFHPPADPDPNRFYMTGVSSNGGRLRVRYWADLALVDVKRNLQDWFRQLKVEYPWADPPPPQRWQLCYAINRDGTPPEHDVLALLRRGIEGQPLGYSMLSAALTRLRHPGGSDKGTKEKSDPMSLKRLRIPMGLIRMCLNDLRRREGKNEMSEGLDETCAIPAYVCGRLMAEYENLQRATARKAGIGDINSTITDRFFSLASTYPAAAFSKIVDLGQKHKKKLRGIDHRTASAIESELMRIESLLQPRPNGPYPSNLSLEEQGLFALGYYHQKARSIAEAMDRRQANEIAKQNNNEEN